MANDNTSSNTSRENYDWIVGANTLDQDSLDAIAELKAIDKIKTRITLGDNTIFDKPI